MTEDLLYTDWNINVYILKTSFQLIIIIIIKSFSRLLQIFEANKLHDFRDDKCAYASQYLVTK